MYLIFAYVVFSISAQIVLASPRQVGGEGARWGEVPVRSLHASGVIMG